MKTSVQIVSKLITILLLFYSCFSTVRAQENNGHEYVGQLPEAIISQSLNNAKLWEESTVSFTDVPTLYVLNHGVELDLPSNLVVSGKPVVLINKGDINALGNPPYFLFHTLKIDEVKAFVRIYLSYDVNGERTTKNEELYFVKTQNGWEVSNNQL
ncbi:hypothetical protein [Maribacter hydrothermalis]|uniref:Uncharacterized protein n=1 Tax=Maribacter hydrothermalis TaxID=1836467 RepID=A0A1B7ZCH8_9FLAO|nr:hypothetical protein [Maribacter hydrothermalis]APQ18043.1 hypothetical protein BTR34_12215 [Maribacter hydrothermalis]OBR40585.1 hypothetical protein A9200_15865 [Maribacter hydrothermalis]